MNDVLVEVYCEATLKGYEFWIPRTALIKDVIQKIAEEIMIYESNDGLFQGEQLGLLVLMNQRTGVLMNRDYTVTESGIKSGDRLILV